MQNLTDHPAIEKYSEEFADIIIKDFFHDKSNIGGQEILNLTPVRQVNLFIIKSLLFQWKKESEKLKSPYFNFQNDEVQKALSTFMNTVSRHIYVDEENIRPLLKKATYDSILLIFFPYVYYLNLIQDWKEEQIQLKDLRQIKKYIKVNDSLINLFISGMEQNNLTAVSKDEADELLNTILEQTDMSPAETEEFEQRFDQVFSFNLNSFLKEDVTSKQPEEQEAPADLYEQDEIIDEPEVVLDSPIEMEESPEAEVTNSNLNDTHNTEEHITLADIHEKQKIEKISRYISINQKFMFINQLFDKDWGKFEKAISFLDETNDKDKIINYLDENAPAWREEGDEAEEFRLILEKKLGEPI